MELKEICLINYESQEILTDLLKLRIQLFTIGRLYDNSVRINYLFPECTICKVWFLWQEDDAGRTIWHISGNLTCCIKRF